MFGAASENGRAVLKALDTLVKLVPAGSVSPAAERNNIQQMAQKNSQQNQQMAALQAQRQQAGGQAQAA